MPELLEAADFGVLRRPLHVRCSAVVSGGRFEIGVNHVGNRSFVGNGAILPTGDRPWRRLPPWRPLRRRRRPAKRRPKARTGSGSPSFRLPNRQKVGGFSEEATYRPSRKLYAQRAVVDALRILIPSYTAFALGLAGLAAVLYGYEVCGMAVTFALLPALGLSAAAISVAIVVCLKWAVMGRFKPVIVPLWSPATSGSTKWSMAPTSLLCRRSSAHFSELRPPPRCYACSVARSDATATSPAACSRN